MYYETYGEGIPIVFIHPPAMGLVTFRKQRPLSEKYKLILYDSRGNGRSGFSNEKITIPLLASDLNALLDEMQVKEAVICSYSNGVSIALEFALSYPNRLKALICSGGFPEVNSFLLAQEFRLGMVTARCKGMKLLATILAISHTKEKQFRRELYEYILKVNPDILYQMYKVGLSYSCTNQLSQITKPTLFIYGSKVDYLHKHYKLFETSINNTETIFVDKASHQVPTKHYLDFNQIIDRFLQKLPSNSS